MERPPIEQPNTLKSEHLKNGEQPIIACVGIDEQHDIERKEIDAIIKKGTDVNFYLRGEELQKSNLKNSGEMTSVISQVDNTSKFTENLYNCTSLVAVGREINSQQNISLLTHNHIVEPSATGYDPIKEESFISSCRESLEELKGRCLEGSIDIIIAGGEFQTGKKGSYRTKNLNDYQKALEILSRVVFDVLGFEPIVVCGPKDSDRDNVYFDTASRRLYIIRPGSSSDIPFLYNKPLLHNDTFQPSNIEVKKKDWEEREKSHKMFGE
jgi:hypothetical protein